MNLGLAQMPLGHTQTRKPDIIRFVYLGFVVFLLVGLLNSVVDLESRLFTRKMAHSLEATLATNYCMHFLVAKW